MGNGDPQGLPEWEARRQPVGRGVFAGRARWWLPECSESCRAMEQESRGFLEALTVVDWSPDCLGPSVFQLHMEDETQAGLAHDPQVTSGWCPLYPGPPG